MVTRQEWEEYVEMAESLSGLTGDCLQFALDVFVGDAYVHSNSARMYEMPGDLEFWLRPHDEVCDMPLEFSCRNVGVKPCIDSLHATLVDLGLLEIG